MLDRNTERKRGTSKNTNKQKEKTTNTCKRKL